MKRNWIKNPTKKDIIIVATFWTVGMLLILLSLSNVFRESLIQAKYSMVYVLIVLAIATVIRLIYNYIKNE